MINDGDDAKRAEETGPRAVRISRGDDQRDGPPRAPERHGALHHWALARWRAQERPAYGGAPGGRSVPGRRYAPTPGRLRDRQPVARRRAAAPFGAQVRA